MSKDSYAPLSSLTCKRGWETNVWREGKVEAGQRKKVGGVRMGGGKVEVGTGGGRGGDEMWEGGGIVDTRGGANK